MHEIGIVRQLLRTVTAFAEENGIKEIREVVVDCGELSLVIPEYVQELYPPVVKGSILEKAKLTVVSSTSIVEGGAHDVLLKDKTPFVSNTVSR